jgi:predicted nucleotidyltransferase component of viral defense system
MLSAEELGADKLLALFDRAQARDFVDVAALVDRFGLSGSVNWQARRTLGSPVCARRDTRQLRLIHT